VHRFEKRQGNGAFSSKLESSPTLSLLLFGSDLGGLRQQKDRVLSKCGRIKYNRVALNTT